MQAEDEEHGYGHFPPSLRDYFRRVEPELHAGSQIQTITGRIPGKECPGTDSEIIQSVLHRVADVRACTRVEPVIRSFVLGLARMWKVEDQQRLDFVGQAHRR